MHFICKIIYIINCSLKCAQQKGDTTYMEKEKEKKVVKKKKGIKKKNLYETNVLPRFDEIKQWKAGGKTDAHISKMLGISSGSLNLYREKYPELEKLMNDSKIVLIENLEHTLCELALGHITTKETKRFIQQNGGGAQNVKVEETIKEWGPNITALIFSLKHYASAEWGDQNNINLNVDSAMTNMNQVFTELKDKLNTVTVKDLKNEITKVDD